MKNINVTKDTDLIELILMIFTTTISIIIITSIITTILLEINLNFAIICLAIVAIFTGITMLFLKFKNFQREVLSFFNLFVCISCLLFVFVRFELGIMNFNFTYPDNTEVQKQTKSVSIINPKRSNNEFSEAEHAIPNHVFSVVIIRDVVDTRIKDIKYVKSQHVRHKNIN